MRRHADASEHDQNRDIEIEAAERARFGSLDQKSADLVLEGRETAPQHGAAALAEVAALPFDGADRGGQAADPVEHAGDDATETLLDRPRLASQGPDFVPE